MIRFAAVTDAGICQKNDDRVMVDGKIVSDGRLAGILENEVLATVCDGVGGYAYGNEAAEISSEVFADMTGKMIDKEVIEATIADANLRVLSAQQIDIEHRNMSTTVAGVYTNGKDIIVFNVGDSKVFRLRNTYLSQMSVEHTAAQEAIDLGVAQSKEDIDIRSRHTITRCIGDATQCRPSITVGENRVFTNDIFLICSDGLSDVVDNDIIEEILNEQGELSTKCENLLRKAFQNDSQDNISIVLLEVA